LDRVALCILKTSQAFQGPLLINITCHACRSMSHVRKYLEVLPFDNFRSHLRAILSWPYHPLPSNVVTFTNRGWPSYIHTKVNLTTCWAIGMQWQPCIHRKDNNVLLAINHCRLNTLLAHLVWPQWEGTIQQRECTCNIQGLIQFENACFISSNLHLFWR